MNWLEGAAVKNCRDNTGILWQRNDFPKTAYSAIATDIHSDISDEDSKRLCDLRAALRFVRPDAYFVNNEDRELCLLEIEDTSMLTELRFSKLADLFWCVDYFEWQLHLFVADRYGCAVRELYIPTFDPEAWMSRERDGLTAHRLNADKPKCKKLPFCQSCGGRGKYHTNKCPRK